MNNEEVDVSDLAYVYEEKILKEFSELVNGFQSKHGFENDSMIRLLDEIIFKLKN